MKRTVHFALTTAFLLVCAGLIAFLHQFTVVEGNFTYPEWETSSIVSADGKETAIDPLAGEPELAEGEFFRFSLTLPEIAEPGTHLIFEITGAETAIFLDGEILYTATSPVQEQTINLGQVQLPLPAGNGRKLTMEIRPLAPLGLFPPLPRMSEDPSDAKGNIAYGNYYSFPAGVMALTLVLTWGLFLFSILKRQTDWRLLLLVLTCVGLTIYPIAVGYGWYFWEEPWISLFSWRGIPLLSALALALYLLLHRDRDFIKALIRLTLWSLGTLTVCWLVSAAKDGYLFRYLRDSWMGLIRTGYYDGLLYWLTAWLITVCTLLSLWDMVRSVVRMKTEAHSLKQKHEMAMDSYRILEERMRKGAFVRHEFSHQLTLLSAMYENKDFDEIGRFLTELKGLNQKTAQLSYTAHFAVNAMLLDAAERAEQSGIRFDASAMLPEKLPIPDEDLCTLFMNLLDNALEGASKTKTGKPFIRLRTSVRNGFLAVFCENSYGGSLSTSRKGGLCTTKSEPEAHGFGMTLMEHIAEKYKSILDVNYTDCVFTVQTALYLPDKSKTG